jgi:prolipoprotein diacylglyceryl transferase
MLSIPSPGDGVWNIGFFPLRGYAVAIICGIALAIWIGDRRWRARGGERGVVADVAVWAVPFGIIGGRLYHVITSPQAYFGEGGDPLGAFRIWEGGLGIWGAVVLGGVGAWIGVRRRGIPLAPFGDALAPGIAVAQAVGRWGNWVNQELFGQPTTLPWGVEIDLENRPVEYIDSATFHPPLRAGASSHRTAAHRSGQRCARVARQRLGLDADPCRGSWLPGAVGPSSSRARVP